MSGKVNVSDGTPRASARTTLARLAVPPFEPLDARLAATSGAEDGATHARVTDILARVRRDGDAALTRLEQELDDVSLGPDAWEVPPDTWHAALERLPDALRAALERAAERVREFHERQRESSTLVLEDDGSRIGTRVLPLEAVGVYVPGGTAAYPSSVLMTAIPAAVAGVERIIAITPPGGGTDAVLAACALGGVTRLFRVGGAHGCAALAYGTATIPRVDKIVGPGNRWVAEAKRQLVGTVGIDMVAGPTEVLIIADDAADPRHVAADLIAQAEHDTDAVAWLVTTHAPLVAAVESALNDLLDAAPRAAIARAALAAHGVAVTVPDMATAIAVANRKAPEHLELLVRDAADHVEAVRHAGAVFVGPHTPEPAGDYLAGPSHVLPTGGTARFASPLGVYDFVKRMSVVQYSPERLAADAEAIQAIAEAEGLFGHAEAVRIRDGA